MNPENVESILRSKLNHISDVDYLKASDDLLAETRFSCEEGRFAIVWTPECKDGFFVEHINQIFGENRSLEMENKLKGN